MEHLSVDGGTTLSRSLQRGSLQRAVWSPHRHRLGLSERAGKLPCLTPHRTENSDLHFTSTPESMRYSHLQGQIWSCIGEVILVNKFPALDRNGGGPDGQWGADDYRKSMMAEESVRQNSEKVRVLTLVREEKKVWRRGGVKEWVSEPSQESNRGHPRLKAQCEQNLGGELQQECARN